MTFSKNAAVTNYELSLLDYLMVLSLLWSRSVSRLEKRCIKTTVSFSWNRHSLSFLVSLSLSLSLQSCSSYLIISSLCVPRLAMARIPGQCGMLTPRGAPTTTTGRLIRRALRLGGVLQTPGVLYRRATLRLTKVQVNLHSVLSSSICTTVKLSVVFVL